jgi:hypothetical protein
MKKYGMVYLTAASVIVLSSQLVFAQNFGGRTDYPLDYWPSSVVSADVNNDSIPDLVIASRDYDVYSGMVSVLMGNGNGTFQDSVNYDAGSQPINVCAADFNADGYKDLAVADLYYAIQILMNNGDGTFQTPQPYTAGSGPRWVVAVDIDLDSDFDLAVSNHLSDNVSIFLNDGNGNFQLDSNYVVGDFPVGVCSGYFNSDNYPDLAVANVWSDNISILINNGDGTFQDTVNYGVGDAANALCTADFNSDGNSDLAVACNLSDSISILMNDGSGIFQAAVNYGVGDAPYDVFTSDFDLDGYPDLVVTNYWSDDISILMNDGLGHFPDTVNYSVGVNPLSVYSDDFDGDNDFDLVVTNSGSENASVLVNLTQQPNWCDDFESYTVGSSICGPLWICSGNDSTIIDSSVSYNGDQSVRMFGVLGGSWGAVADRSLNASFPMTIKMAIRNGTENLSGAHPFRASGVLRTGPHWSDPGIGLFVFLENGDLKISSSATKDTISGFALEEWYEIWIEAWDGQNDSLYTRYWVNGVFIGEYSIELTPQMDFESYPPDSSICGPNWICSGNDSVIADPSVSYTGDQSVKMYGVVGGCWGAVACRTIVTFPITIDFAVRNGTEPLSGCHPARASAELKSGDYWGDPGFGLIHFRENGDLVIQTSTVRDTISGFLLEQWYKVSIEIWDGQNDSLYTRYWIDGGYLGEYSLALDSIPPLDSITHLFLAAQEGTVWFDDVCVSTGLLISCDYVVGDANGSESYNGLDITYGVSYLKGGPSPACGDCSSCSDWHYCGDVNGSCSYNGLDITYGVAFLKGGSSLIPCQDCPALVNEPMVFGDNPTIQRKINARKRPSVSEVITAEVRIANQNSLDFTVDIGLQSENPVAFICLPLEWQTDDVSPVGFEPGDILSKWDEVWFDLKDGRFLFLAWNDLLGESNNPLQSNGNNVDIGKLMFSAKKDYDIRSFTLEPFEDERNGTIILGLPDGITLINPEFNFVNIAESKTTTIEGLIPDEYSISQSYPNPFNAKAIIRFALPEASHVNISIYDLLGRKIETLVNGEQPAGYHQVKWDSKDKASGAYFYTIHAGDFVDSKKMLLVK